ncbi:MAG: hypothetical protein JNJ90_13565 [Saprospiraceae bacterium]|jgi:hypothetical protein|nr:hypothetical protein [Saprospiraceae bacterium]
MNKDWFEKNLRENYPPEAHDFDADAAWAALEARRRKKRRRPFVFWWTSALGVLLLGAAGLALWQPGKDETPAQTPNSMQPAVQLTQKSPVAASKKVTSRLDVAKPIAQQTGQEPSVATPPPTPPPTGRGGVEYARALPSPENTSRPPSPSGEGPGVGPMHAGAHHVTPALSFLEPKIILLEPASQNLPELPGFLPGEFKKRPKSKEPRWWVGGSVYYGLSSVRRDGSAEYLKIRDSEETALDMFQTGFDARLRLGNRFFVQTGIYFTQWTDVRKQVFKETFTTLDSNYLIARLIKADGSVEDIYGAAEIVHTRTVTEETYNRYSHLELPLLAGVSLPVGGRWRLDGSVGPVFGLLAVRSGSISGDLNGAKLPLEDAPYRNGLTFSGMLRLEWMYATQDWAAGVGIMGRVALNDWAETNPLFSEKRHAIGAGLVFRKAIR